ncbi:hypothetical protein [Flavobacterium sp. LB1P62]|uniref:hypothetical protein n=1 Tax=unclassified Flavobacterium TaxID=196869 RepID=UPI003AB0230D
MKKYLTLFLILISSYSYCQKTFSFISKIHPEKTYSLQMDISSINETTINDKTSKSTSISRFTRVTRTEKANKNGQFPATMNFGEVIVSGAGKEVLSPLSKTIIKGLLSEDSKFNIDTIINPNLDLQTKNALKSVFKDLKPDIDFPKKPLKIDDSFEHKIPMNIPINGEQIKVLITKIFTLKSVSNNIAEFTVSEIISLNMESQNVKASGDGNGIVEFNILENQIVKDKSHFTIDITVKKENINVRGFITSDSEKLLRIQ